MHASAERVLTKVPHNMWQRILTHADTKKRRTATGAADFLAGGGRGGRPLAPPPPAVVCCGGALDGTCADRRCGGTYLRTCHSAIKAGTSQNHQSPLSSPHRMSIAAKMRHKSAARAVTLDHCQYA